MRVGYRRDDGVRHATPGRTLAKVAALALGVTLFSTTSLSGALAQQDDEAVTVGGGGSVVADDLIEAILADVFAAVFGPGAADDTGDVSGGDLNVGGNVGGNITMGGSSGGGITIGGSSGGSGVESGG